MVEVGGPSLENSPGSEPTDPVDHKASDHQKESLSRKVGVHYSMTRDRARFPPDGAFLSAVPSPPADQNRDTERHQPASKHPQWPQEWTSVSSESGSNTCLRTTPVRRAIGHRSPFFSRSTGPPSFRTCLDRKRKVSLHPDHGNTRFTPNHRMEILSFGI